MALMGAPSKGYGNSSGNRGRAFGMLLLLAFGAAVFGVMLLQKVRERRVLDLLLKDRDRKILSLQFLVQKERVTTKEVKRKIEAMREKINSLRSQKMELHNRIMEMQSMTGSLKEEHRTLEAALENKEKEIKILREKETSSTEENPEIIALRELLKQKESEIEEMKHHNEKHGNIWSVSADDPSNPSVNLMAPGNTVGEDKNEVRVNKEESVTAKDQQLQESMNMTDGQNSTSRHEDRDGSGIEGKNEMVIPIEEQLKTSDSNQVGENSTDRGASMQDSTQRNGELEKPEVSQEHRGLIERNQSRSDQAKEDESSHDGELLKTGDAEIIDGKDHGAIRDADLGKLINPQDNDTQAPSVISNGEMKLEVQPDVSQIGIASRARGRRKMRHRRRRKISREGDLKKSGKSEEEVDSQRPHRGGFSMTDEHAQAIADKSENEGLVMKTETDNQVALEGREGAVSDTERVEIPMSSGDEGLMVRSERGEDKPVANPGEGEKQGLEVSSDSESLNPLNPPHSEDSGGADTDNQSGKEQETPQDEKLQNPGESEDGEGLNRLADDSIEQNQNVGQKPEDQETMEVEKPVDWGATDNIMDGEKAEDGNGNKEAENLEVHHVSEQTGKTTEGEDDVPGILVPELKKDIEENGHEDNTEVEF